MKPRFMLETKPSAILRWLILEKIHRLLWLQRLKFSGNTNEDSEEFLVQLMECIGGADILLFDILWALLNVLSSHVARWLKTVKDDETFERGFRSRFLKRYDREDFLADLRQQTQEKGEKIANYLASFLYITTTFLRPPPEHVSTNCISELTSWIWESNVG